MAGAHAVPDPGFNLTVASDLFPLAAVTVAVTADLYRYLPLPYPLPPLVTITADQYRCLPSPTPVPLTATVTVDLCFSPLVSNPIFYRCLPLPSPLSPNRSPIPLTVTAYLVTSTAAAHLYR